MARNEGPVFYVRLVAAAFVFVPLALLARPPAVAAFATECDIFVNGENVLAHGTPASALAVPADEDVQLSGSTNGQPIESATVSILFGPIPIATVHPVAEGQTSWDQSIPISDYTRFGAGYYQVVGNVDQCQFSAWFKVTDAGFTPAAIVGLGVAAAGAVIAGTGLLAGARGSGGLARSIIGGAMLGGGSLVVAQQTGLVPADTGNIVTWTVLPGGAGGVAHMLLGGFISRRPSEQPTGPGYGPGAYGQPPYGQPPGYGHPPYPPPTGGPPPEYTPPPPPAPPDPVLTDGPTTAPITTASPPPEPVPLPTPPIIAGVGAAIGSTPPPEPESEPEPDPEAESVPSAPRPTRGGHPTHAKPPDHEADAGPAPAAAGAPPRSSYAHIECPEAVVAEEQFELVVGLGREADTEVVGGPLIVPERIVGAYTMTIQVIADGFRLVRPNESWRVDLRVTGDAPYPTGVLHLAAEAQTRPIVARTVRAMYSIEGQAVGLAARPIAVARDAALLATSEPPPQEEPVDIVLPTDAVRTRPHDPR